jgi:hypothetical protein
MLPVDSSTTCQFGQPRENSSFRSASINGRFCSYNTFYLLADEVHPPEYYLKQIEEFNKSDFTTEDYSEDINLLLDQIEEHWYKQAATAKKVERL